ncbi:MAG: UDP-N-acetylmuramoyl-tripeptide--D-alanyl-D-alanine ligase, partial [Gemmatimonadetes bacterium]|nr:UDP-N-acetylmuramoyl-tripeptide--D-alanyl-D-alanine ligase [Gemmatimonadota bacterium]NIR36060.1 UDP-N-acetylmuramoyl-tripeptide--D-alanyl-D-alanine ligase [Actinomycetota bacterium]NIS30322.1 UDP-N-acetylmuramoyl-tripeptide--D-alanyl-D-alanine ligase [Actinomycetota bacterium]NIU65552.1 UDP-N-acetylmuramoyl-tripeptide--D-alanyl-D-alanine ligase [Actinomycetota bacterium]NIW27368.1 UDP-N-acetylmuramoyl-tripeptide--D-alanyl-D-alanine ligase [Actinomycetota bacterium]
GVTVVDDTYNSNPAGARAALALLGRVGDPGGRRVLVTPGMVEMGPVQAEENARLAAE